MPVGTMMFVIAQGTGVVRTHPTTRLGRIFRIKERYELNLLTNKSGVPTAGFGFIATGNTGIVTNTQTPTSRQGTVVARFRF